MLNFLLFFQKKYFSSKRDVGFCIPGFQVINISDGKLVKHGKDYGKNLDGEGVRKGIFYSDNYRQTRT